MSTYTIKAGDTLTAIARRFNVSIGTLADMNGIEDINLIHTGDVLTIPDAPASAPVTLDQSGNVVNVPAVIPPPSNVPALTLSDWFQPPKIYYVLGAVALGLYLFDREGKRR